MIMDSSNTAGNSMKKPRGRPFTKGDPRINRKGRPKSFDALRELARAIGHEEATSKGEVVVINGKKATITEAILRQWAASKNHQLQRAFIEIAYGKVPDKHEITGKDGIGLKVEIEYINSPVATTGLSPRTGKD